MLVLVWGELRGGMVRSGCLERSLEREVEGEEEAGELKWGRQGLDLETCLASW